jgi:hypothetical protein
VRILITGGAGVIGSHLADFLVAQGHHVLVVDNLSTGRMAKVEHLLADDWLRFFDDIILDESLTDDVAAGVDQVYHSAACVGVKHIIDDPVGCVHTNVDGISVVLERPTAHGKRTVIPSSSEVHGESTEVPLAEESDCLLVPPTVRRWSYALSKGIDEHWPLPTREAASRSPWYASSAPTTRAWTPGAMGESLLASSSRRSRDDPSRGTAMASRPAASPTSTTPYVARSRLARSRRQLEGLPYRLGPGDLCEGVGGDHPRLPRLRPRAHPSALSPRVRRGLEGDTPPRARCVSGRRASWFSG